jgi:hypothetical protein
MQNKPPKGIFPSQSVLDAEKAGSEYGMKVAKAIESEWFRKDNGSDKYQATKDNFHRLRLYARGEQSIQKYKDELAINGDLSYLNLDWKPVPIIPKFVDIVVNGMSDRVFDIKTYSQDPDSLKEKTDYVESMLRDMNNRILLEKIDTSTGINMFKNDPKELPQTKEELSVKMQLEYKPSIEIAQEEALSNVFDLNKFDLVKRRCDYDQVVIGMSCAKSTFNTAEGIRIEYVDPVDIVYSYTDSPYFDDLYYVGEVRRITISELKKFFPQLTNSDIKEIEDMAYDGSVYRSQKYSATSQDNFVDVLFFEYKTFNNQVYKIKNTSTGAKKAIEKTDEFDPPKDAKSQFEKVQRSIEVLYEGAKIIGMEKLLKWKLCENMTRPKSDITKVNMSYCIVAPRIYQGRPESLVSRMTSFADMVQLTHLKLQQVMSRLVPDGIYMDADGLAEIDLGNGTNYNPQEALNMYFQTGSVIGRSMTADGDMNPARVPITELQSGSGGAKIQSLITTYNYYMQMLRDVTGLNEARDGSKPDSNALVGLQKMAAANSNTATKHILQAGLYLTLRMAEITSLRLSDAIEYSSTRSSFINSLGKFNVATLQELHSMHLHDFGIYISLEPDEEEKQLLENNIQVALQRDQITLDDVIDIREVKNLKLANQLLKLRRRKKADQDRAIQMQNIQAQTQSNAQAAQASAEAEMQKEQALASTKSQLLQVQHNLDMEKMQREVDLKRDLMRFEFDINQQLKQLDLQVINTREEYKEDRKDKRTKIQASQQSELIDQRKNNKPPKDFESSGNDLLGGFNL